MLTSLLRPAVRVGVRGVGPVPVVREPHQLILFVVVLVLRLRFPQHLAHRGGAAVGPGLGREAGKEERASSPAARELFLNGGFVWSFAGGGGCTSPEAGGVQVRVPRFPARPEPPSPPRPPAEESAGARQFLPEEGERLRDPSHLTHCHTLTHTHIHPARARALCRAQARLRGCWPRAAHSLAGEEPDGAGPQASPNAPTNTS